MDKDQGRAKSLRCRNGRLSNRTVRCALCGLAAFLIAMVLFLMPLTIPEKSKAHTVASDYNVKPITLSGTTGVVVLDHLAYDRTNGTIWVPGSNTGNVYIIKENSDAVSVVPGFNTGEVEVEGQKAKMGPTAVSLGEGVVYIGNRADSTLCAINAQTFERESCVDVKSRSRVADAGPHGVSYIAATHEVWVTTGPGKSIEVFDATEPRYPKWKMEIPLESGSEGYAVDNRRARFYTNLEQIGKTVSIDVRSHQVVGRWDVGSHDLQGIALDTARGFVFVACADHVVSLNADHEGKIVDSIITGGGLDDIDFSAEQNVLYAAASVTATLAIAEVSNDGKFHLKTLVPTVKGGRGVTAAKDDSAYVIDPAEGRVLKVSHK
jgi:hypothetical protein